MGATIQIREQAHADLEEIVDYFAERNSNVAIRFVLVAYRQFQFLSEWPGAGAIRSRVPKRLKGLRSWPMKQYPKYLIFYIPTDEGIEIVRVIHGARNLGPLLRNS